MHITKNNDKSTSIYEKDLYMSRDVTGDFCSRMKVSCRISAYSLQKQLRKGFGWACNWESLYPERIISGTKKSFRNKLTGTALSL